eukprot:scaffold27462_cov20-Tisochrysis_lutea.AAC.1
MVYSHKATVLTNGVLLFLAACEQQKWESLIVDLDANLLMSLALGQCNRFFILKPVLACAHLLVFAAKKASEVKARGPLFFGSKGNCKGLATCSTYTRKGKSHIAVPAYEGRYAEAKKVPFPGKGLQRCCIVLKSARDCLVWDYGSRHLATGNPRALWLGLEFIRYACTKMWLGREAAARCGALPR